MSDKQETPVVDEFAAGFNGTPTVTPPEPEVSPDEQNTPEVASEPEAPKYRQVTEDEWNQLNARAAVIDEIKATHAKQLDTAFGKIGGIERVLRQYQEQTPAGQSVEITKDDLAEIASEYPELADAQLSAFKRVAEKLRGTGKSMDESAVRQVVEPELVKLGDNAVLRAKKEIATETLDETHPDWQTVIGNVGEDTDYRKWLSAQPQEYQARVNASYSPTVIGRSIDKFREDQAALKKQADTDRRERLKDAVTPKGDEAAGPSDTNDDFMAGFNGR